MAASSREPRVGGMIGYHGLAEWWLSAFTDGQRQEMELLYDQQPGPASSPWLRLAGGDHTSFRTSQSAARFVGALARLADRAVPMIVPALLAKKEELALASGHVVDLHYAYGTAAKLWYGRRHHEPAALRAAIDACEKQIAIAARALLLLRIEGLAPTAHRGYQQLAIIREKQGDYEEALRLSREADAQGWLDGTDDWGRRIARLERRLARAR